ncbi:helix-turn-helix domain-containing protein [Streptomyces monashensis]|uniref:Transcriptional regulator n=1 Tax=Streptomyces monashensis TaxID=1678012 RepID=A0A1S2PJM8_9ACTN|nr:helix-turn-helix transcriptional regulator [Streptomyces monashensis]OIJ93971.1 transcriptional regulator [Streptomyces monashensis]
MTNQVSNEARVIPLRPAPVRPQAPETEPGEGKEPLWRDLVGEVLRRERRAQDRTLKDVADTARISLPYLSEIERGRKEASSEVLAAAAHALGLGLGDLLSLAHGELTLRTSVQRRPAAVPHRPSGVLCLAA